VFLLATWFVPFDKLKSTCKCVFFTQKERPETRCAVGLKKTPRINDLRNHQRKVQFSYAFVFSQFQEIPWDFDDIKTPHKQTHAAAYFTPLATQVAERQFSPLAALI
jgi:hypothetical protein